MPRPRLAVAPLAVLAVTAAAGFVHQHHRVYAEWGLFPSATPPRLPVDGRDYDREGPVTSVPAGSVVLARTAGGATVLGPPGVFPPTVIEMRTGTGLTGYALSGSP